MDSFKLERLICPALNILPPNTSPRIYADAIAYFEAIPWTAALLKKPRTIAFVPQTVNPADENDNQFFSQTLLGERGLRHMLCLFTCDDDAHARDPERPITKVHVLYAVGPALGGYPGILHGGMTMTMMDEGMSVINELNLALGKTSSVFQSTSVTAGLDIKFVRGVPIDSCVCVTAQVDGWEGRKTRISAVLTGAQNEVLAKCTSMWVALKAKV
ncbi:hypothetical protein VHEMI09406 [[Torrubiella] hemipterigena]|uniref:Thioesterase domain-containing protein n=1 Tax=[Torrubiella] hemipterigena TaxID=1531966 RepID=A0A0A1TQ96_9HYPO|nr:hypothetical protein VHEMI09406 [[Torrubiella] hemipterigena]